MSINGWETDSDAWDSLLLDGTTLPGVWKVEPTISRVLDVKVRRGQDAAVIKDRGTEPTRFRIEGQVIDGEDQWQAFAASFQKLAPRRGASRGAVTIIHPAAQLYGVTAVMIETVQGPEIRNGIAMFYLDALEWVPATKRKRPKPNPTGDSTVVNDPNYPDWAEGTAWLSYSPPSQDVDIDVLLADNSF